MPKSPLMLALSFAILSLSFPAFAEDKANNYTYADDSTCDDSPALPKGYSYTDDCQFSEGLTVVTKDNKYGFVNTQGKIVIPATYDDAFGFDDGLALVKTGDKYGYLFPNGKYAITPQFDDAWGFSEDLAKISQNGKFGFIDKAGKIVIPATYQSTSNWFQEGLLAVQQGDKWGFIDKTGKVKIDFKYDIIDDFSEGLALVGNKNGKQDKNGPTVKFGYINNNGNIAIPLKYDYATSFFDGVATVILDNHIYLIDHNNKKQSLEK